MQLVRPMYEAYFSFRGNPFSIAPNPRYLYLSDQHREALAHLQYGLQENGGFILLTGEVGTGKTTVWRCLAERVPDDVDLAVILNPRLSDVELIESICDELGIAYDRDCGLKRLVDALNRHLLKIHGQGRRTVIIIDEAQNLSADLLEQLRLLTNLETNECKLLQTILIGQPELLDKLNSPDLRQLRQRITARFHLKPLTTAEVRAYVAHRLSIVGGSPTLFSNDVLLRLSKLSGGIPRLVNLICDRALLGCFSENRRRVDLRTLERAAHEVMGERQPRKTRTSRHIVPQAARPALRRGFAIAAALMLAVAAYLFSGRSLEHFPQQLQLAAVSVSESVFAPETSGVNAAQAPVVDEAAVAEAPDTSALPALPAAADAVADDVSAPAPAASLPAVAGGFTVTHQPVPLHGDWRDALAAQQKNNEPHRVLLGLWGINLPRESAKSPCEYALRHRLDCWHRRGSLASLVRVNRPALVKLLSKQGTPFYAVLTGITDDGDLKMSTGGTTTTISKSEINDAWTGEYTLLWRRPTSYRNTLYPGDKSDSVRWITKQIATLSGDRSPASHSSVYTVSLETRVRKLQKKCGLFVDGLIGRETLIKINTLVSKTPLLRTGEGCRSKLG